MKQTEHQGIAFDKYILERVNFKVNPDFIVPKGGLPVDFSFEVSNSIDKEEKRLKTSLTITVQLKEIKNPPIDVNVSVAGYFSMEESGDINNLEEFSEVNAPAFLFPFAREVIANLSLNSGYPPLLIPPANIRALIGMQKVTPDKIATKKKVPKKKLPKKKVPKKQK